MKTYFFDNFPEFVSEDTRNNRIWSPVTIDSLSNRQEATLPPELIKDSTVLDLGCCLGASGQWCLANGATHYTGVEVQPLLASKANQLLSKYWSQDQFIIQQQDILDFLSSNDKKYDVIVLVGVIYAFLDQFGLLKKITDICNKTIVVDSVFYGNYNFPTINLVVNQNINSGYKDTLYQGVGARISPKALKIIMGVFGFEDTEGFIIPEPSNSKDHQQYSTMFDDINVPNRYLLRFNKTNNKKLKTLRDVILEDDLSTALNHSETRLPSSNSPIPKWQFDENVALRFQQEAEQHIPDYEKVIDMCVNYADFYFNDKNINIIDIGSALGHTIDKFVKQGYTHVRGVDNSHSMIANSLYPDNITLSDVLPDGPWNLVLANWTMHFINKRYDYFNTIYKNLHSDGMLIVSDKMACNDDFIKNLYYDFKLKNGVTAEVIEYKEKSLVGVLNPKPLQWYLTSLKDIGFREVYVINSRFMFNTICAIK
jgi:2-polyprenyl-3-methyl-5-hydroxy-6-metoxy-1,4-benzoquinol methylase